MFQRLSKIAFASALMIAASQSAIAQEANRVEAKTDWSVFEQNNNGTKQCWVVTAPTKVENTRNGTKVNAKRGAILLFVTYVPSAGVKGEVSFEGGYPFRANSTVQLQIGSTKYDLWPTGETAWAASPAEDAKIRASMQKGATAVITGISGRGTQTKDTFSLSGFTAALADAAKRCQ